MLDLPTQGMCLVVGNTYLVCWAGLEYTAAPTPHPSHLHANYACYLFSIHVHPHLQHTHTEYLYTLTVVTILTFWSAFCTFSGLAGARRSIRADWRRKGRTDIKISAARKREQIGSAMSQPNCWIRREEMMTATLPRVSART